MLERSHVIAKPSPIDDRQQDLEADLQFLLDAQAEGLQQGQEGVNDRDSTGSTTPTVQSVRDHPRRTSRPMRKKPGLRSARKGIFTTINALASVKADELDAIDAENLTKEDILARIADWETKRSGLEEALRNVDDGEDTVRAQRLRQEADALQEEINVVELQLADMKARQRKLLRQVERVENSVQAKLASYTRSLEMLEKDVKTFLRAPRADARDVMHSQTEAAETKSLWQLSPQHRTLELAKVQWTEERDAVLQQRKSVEHEHSALIEGAVVWRAVIAQMADFEKHMREETTRLPARTPTSQSAWEEPEPAQASDQKQPSERLTELLEHMDATIVALDEHFKLAEEKDWKLLIAAIGAELAALRQGRTFLCGLLGHDPSPDAISGEVENENNEGNGVETDVTGDEIHELDRSFETARKSATPPLLRDSDSEDDPDPELLFSSRDVGHEGS